MIDPSPLRRMLQRKLEALEAAKSECLKVASEIATVEARLNMLRGIQARALDLQGEAEKDIQELNSALENAPHFESSASQEITLKNASGDIGVKDSLDFTADCIDLDAGERVKPETIEVRRAVLNILLSHAEGAKTHELVSILTEQGVKIGGTDPVSNLSAILSRTPFFMNVSRRWMIDREEAQKHVRSREVNVFE